MNRLRQIAHLATWAGLALCVTGAALLVVAWAQTADKTNVALQIPYVVSAGFTGLGLVVVGLTVVSTAAKQREARERQAQAAELRQLLTQIRQAVEENRS